MKTRKTFGWLMLAASLFVMGSAQVMAEGEKKEETPSVPIPLITSETFDGGNYRGLLDTPFTAYYQAGTIYISTSAEFSSISITVMNESICQVWNSTTDMSDGMGEICIPNGGAGNYTVEIITEYGECFTGGFRL